MWWNDPVLVGGGVCCLLFSRGNLSMLHFVSCPYRLCVSLNIWRSTGDLSISWAVYSVAGSLQGKHFPWTTVFPHLQCQPRGSKTTHIPRMSPRHGSQHAQVLHKPVDKRVIPLLLSSSQLLFSFASSTKRMAMDHKSVCALKVLQHSPTYPHVCVTEMTKSLIGIA